MFGIVFLFLALIGVILGLAGFATVVRGRPDAGGYPNRGPGFVLLGVGLAVFVFGMFFATMRQVPSGSIGVITRFGDVTGDTLPEGLHFTHPFNSVQKMTLRTQTFTMASTGETPNAIAAKSKDGATLTIDLTVLYRLEPEVASNVFQTVGPDYEEKIIVPAIRAVVRQSATRMLAIEAFDEAARAAFALDVEVATRERITGRGVVIEQVQVRNIDLPARVEGAISEKLEAEQAAERKEFELIAAAKDAEIRRVEAEGIRDAQEIINETLTDRYLQFEYIATLRAIAEGPNDTFVIMPMDQNLTPLLAVDSGGNSAIPGSSTRSAIVQ